MKQPRAAAPKRALMTLLTIASMGALLLTPACKESGPDPAKAKACADALAEADRAWGVALAGLDKDIEANTLDPERARLNEELKALGEKLRADIQDPEKRKVEEERAAAVEATSEAREAYVAALKDLRAEGSRIQGAYKAGFEAVLETGISDKTLEKTSAVEEAGAAYEAALKKTTQNPGLVSLIPSSELRMALGGTSVPGAKAATECLKVEMEKTSQ